MTNEFSGGSTPGSNNQPNGPTHWQGGFPQGGQTPHGQPYYVGPPQQPESNRNRTLLIVLIATVGVVALMLIGVVALILSSSSDAVAARPSAEAVYSHCAEQFPGATAAALTTDEKSIQFSSGAYPDSEDFEMLECMMEAAKAPSAVESRMNNTRALDGTQDAEWEGWSAFWTYHPKNGLDITFTAE